MSYDNKYSSSESNIQTNKQKLNDTLKNSAPVHVRVRRLSVTDIGEGLYLKRNRDKIKSPPPSPLGRTPKKEKGKVNN